MVIPIKSTKIKSIAKVKLYAGVVFVCWNNSITVVDLKPPIWSHLTISEKKDCLINLSLFITIPYSLVIPCSVCPCVSVVPFIPTILRSLGPLALKNRAGLPSPRHLHKVHLSRQWFACMDIWLISLDTEFTNPMFSYFWGLLTPMLGFCWGLPHFWTYFEHVIHFKVLAQHGPNWQMAWQQSFISCICPSHNGAGICLKKDPLKLNSAIFTGKIRWFTMIDHVILHAKKNMILQRLWRYPIDSEMLDKEAPGRDEVFWPRRVFEDILKGPDCWDGWMVDDGVLFFFGSPQSYLDDGCGGWYFLDGNSWGAVPVSVLGLYLFLCSLATCFYFVWIMSTPPLPSTTTTPPPPLHSSTPTPTPTPTFFPKHLVCRASSADS